MFLNLMAFGPNVTLELDSKLLLIVDLSHNAVKDFVNLVRSSMIAAGPL